MGQVSNKLLTLLLFLIIILSIFGVRKYREFKDKEQQWEQVLKAKETQATIWRDKYERSNAHLDHMIVTQSIFRKANEKMLDSLRKELNIKPKTVKEYVEVKTEIALPPTTVVLTEEGKFSFEDEWAKIAGTLSKDSLSLEAKFNSRLRIITHDERYGFLNLKNKSVVRFVTDNPYETITGVRQTEIAHKQKPVAFGLQVGYGITTGGLSPYAGLGFTIRL